jgi:hypothetical protein
MMVLREISVECPAKIAMTALLNAFGTMRLLPDYDPPRLIFLAARMDAFVNPKMGRELSPPGG